MANPIWSTPGGSLGIVPENQFFSLQLIAHDPQGGAVTFRELAGTFPPGMHITRSGSLQGIPIITETINVNRSYQFTIRAQDQNGLVTDRTFNLSISNIVPPQITPRITNLGSIFDGSFYNRQLRAIEVNPNATLTWTLTGGTLPPGMSLSTDGVLSGFITPVPIDGNNGAIGFGSTPFNQLGFENAPTYQNNVFTFTIKVYDGVNYDSLTYTIKIIAKGNFEADTTLDTVDLDLTVDKDNRYVPIMSTPSQALPPIRSSSKFAFKFEAYDPNYYPLTFTLSTGGSSGFSQDGAESQTNTHAYASGTTNWEWTFTNPGTGSGFDTTGFDQSSLSVPPGLTLDTTSGWLTGTIGYQAEAVKVYDFNISAFETDYPTYVSKAVQYSMTVLGDVTNTITWTTAANLGVIDNGSISQLSVSAVSHANKTLVYSLVSDLSHIPQGLQVLPSGIIVGRTTFEYFTLDGDSTTIDGGSRIFDNLYTFTVLATSTDNTVSSTKEFTIRINNYNKTPYEDLYLKALPTLDQRQTFFSIVNNTEIFPENLIYRSGDPNFGRARDLRSLFLAGLTPSMIDDYAAAMATNTFNKRIEFSDIKTAEAVDANFNTKYEVVYIELKDDAVYKGKSPANRDYDSYISAYTYPNSFANMTSVIETALGYANRGALPEWMTSPQADKKTLGFTRAIVLAYTIPGASKLIAYRLKSNNITFSNIDFVVDRYDLDNVYSKNYDINNGKFILGRETTFDRIKRPGTVPYSADYGLRGMSFDMIHGQTVDSVRARGGLDGITEFVDQQTVLFLQQENYAGVKSGNDGWTINGAVIPGWNEYKNSVSVAKSTAGFPTDPVQNQTNTLNGATYFFTNYDDYGVPINPGVWRLANLRSGVWKINISNSNIITLTFAQLIQPGNRVQINYGISQTNGVVFYDTALKPGNSVPSFSTIPVFLSSVNSNTRFDNYGTKFIANRDKYTTPGNGNTWLKFPRIGVLH